MLRRRRKVLTSSPLTVVFVTVVVTYVIARHKYLKICTPAFGDFIQLLEVISIMIQGLWKHYNEAVFDDVHNSFSKIQPEQEQRTFTIYFLKYCLKGGNPQKLYKMNIGYTAANGKQFSPCILTNWRIHFSAKHVR